MTRPTECKWCGCGDVLTSSEAFVHFGCGSGYWPGSDQWTYAGECVGKCAARVAELEERIKRAVEVLGGGRRYDFIASYTPHMGKRSDGEFLEYEQAEQAIKILEGERDGKAD